MTDREKNRFSARAKRYASVGSQGRRRGRAHGRRALLRRARSTAPAMPLELAAALGGLKGPIMKVAQLLATIPDALPPEYATELTKLQSQAPPMGWAFVKRRMQAELGADWQKKFASFEHHPAAAASLGQVHRARALDGARAGLQAAISRHAVGGRSRPAAAATAVRDPPALRSGDRHQRDRQGDRRARCARSSTIVREAKHVALYRDMLDGRGRDPRAGGLAGAFDRPAADARLARRHASCSTHKDDALAVRNRLATAMFTAWWLPFSRFGVIHGDPHLGNYTVFDDARASPPASTCSTTAASASSRRASSAAWSISIDGLLHGDDDLVVHAYETWGFKRLNARADRHRSISGRASSTARCSTTACAPSPTASSRRNTAAAKRSGSIRR